MTRNAGDLFGGRDLSNGVTTTLAIKGTTLFAKVTLQVDPFQESGNSIDSRAASGESDFSTAPAGTAIPA
jgi:hypothetical protein